MKTNDGLDMRELKLDELDAVAGGFWQVIGGFLAGYVLEKALDKTPVGAAVDKLLEPIPLPWGK